MKKNDKKRKQRPKPATVAFKDIKEDYLTSIKKNKIAFDKDLFVGIYDVHTEKTYKLNLELGINQKPIKAPKVIKRKKVENLLKIDSPIIPTKDHPSIVKQEVIDDCLVILKELLIKYDTGTLTSLPKFLKKNKVKDASAVSKALQSLNYVAKLRTGRKVKWGVLYTNRNIKKLALNLALEIRMILIYKDKYVKPSSSNSRYFSPEPIVEAKSNCLVVENSICEQKELQSPKENKRTNPFVSSEEIIYTNMEQENETVNESKNQKDWIINGQQAALDFWIKVLLELEVSLLYSHFSMTKFANDNNINEEHFIRAITLEKIVIKEPTISGIKWIWQLKSVQLVNARQVLDRVNQSRNGEDPVKEYQKISNFHKLLIKLEKSVKSFSFSMDYFIEENNLDAFFVEALKDRGIISKKPFSNLDGWFFLAPGITEQQSIKILDDIEKLKSAAKEESCKKSEPFIIDENTEPLVKECFYLLQDLRQLIDIEKQIVLNEYLLESNYNHILEINKSLLSLGYLGKEGSGLDQIWYVQYNEPTLGMAMALSEAIHSNSLSTEIVSIIRNNDNSQPKQTGSPLTSESVEHNDYAAKEVAEAGEIPEQVITPPDSKVDAVIKMTEERLEAAIQESLLSQREIDVLTEQLIQFKAIKEKKLTKNKILCHSLKKKKQQKLRSIKSFFKI